MSQSAVENAVDNDVILKAICFGLVADFWPETGALGALGAARYVVADAIDRPNVRGERDVLAQALEDFFGSAPTLEPTEKEVGLAAELELGAQRQQLGLDPGESLLAAIVLERAIAALETGDKRAIKALEGLIDVVPRVAGLAGRVRCLEQLVLKVLEADGGHERVQAGVCAEPGLDTALSISFQCASGGNAGREQAVKGLQSYLGDLRSDASRILGGNAEER